MEFTIQHFINGELINNSDQFLPIYNPSFGMKIGKVCVGTQQEVELAINAAKKAFLEWKTWSVLKRSRIMFAFKALLEQRKNEIATLISKEHGKVFSDALGEVQRGIEVVEFACGAPYLLKGTFSHTIAAGMDCYDLRQPLGICVGITPFNFPAMVPMWMFPIAIVCGNTFILKPSEKDPSVSIYLAQLLQQAGLPKGVFNVIHGQQQVVESLIKHPDVAAISFVGSTPIAKKIYETGTAHGKRVQALGGAKNHAVIMPDADLNQVVPGVIGAAFGSAGQRCMAVSVIVAVGDETVNRLIPLLKENIKALSIGESLNPVAELGPVISHQHQQKILNYIAQGIEQGATIIIDGRQIHIAECENGYFLGPTLFDHVSPDMSIYKEEIFGPVLCIVRMPNLQEAVELINNNPYANGTVIYTEQGAHARYFMQHVHAGMVGINVPIPVPLAFHSFGGWKNSLYGSHHMHGEEGIEFYTRLQTISSRWNLNDVSTSTQLAMPVLS